MNNKYTKIIVAIIVIIISFYLGMKYGQRGNRALPSPMANGGQFQGQGLAGGNRAGGTAGGARNLRAGSDFTAGTILSKDDKSITISVSTGGSKIIFLSASTTVQKTTDGATSDLIVGKAVSVNGSANPDGSITAQSVQLRSAMPIPPVRQ